MKKEIEEYRKIAGDDIADCIEEIINVLIERRIKVGRSAYILEQAKEMIEGAARNTTLDVIVRSAKD